MNWVGIIYFFVGLSFLGALFGVRVNRRFPQIDFQQKVTFGRRLRALAWIAGIVCLAMATITGVLFTVNVAEAIQTFVHSRPGLSETPFGRFASRIDPETFPFSRFLLPWCQDKSALSPLMLMLLAGVATLRCFDVARAREHGIRLHPLFPFFPGYQRLLVEMGLVGTLFGFLLVGGSMNQMSQGRAPASPTAEEARTAPRVSAPAEPSEPSADELTPAEIEQIITYNRERSASSTRQIQFASEILLLSFSTAIISTFVAVVLAYLLTPLITAGALLALRMGMNPQPVTPEDSVLGVIAKLRTIAAEATQALEGLKDGVEELIGTAVRLKESMDEVETSMETVKTSADQTSPEVQKLGEESKISSSMLTNLGMAADVASTPIGAMGASSRLTSHRVQKLGDQLSTTTASTRVFGTTAREVDQALEKLKQKLRELDIFLEKLRHGDFEGSPAYEKGRAILTEHEEALVRAIGAAKSGVEETLKNLEKKRREIETSQLEERKKEKAAEVELAVELRRSELHLLQRKADDGRTPSANVEKGE